MKTARRIFVGAGEASGDRILAELIAGLRTELRSGSEPQELAVAGFGGPLCAAQGLQSLFPLGDLAVNGLADVLRRALSLAGRYATIRRALIGFEPDLVLLVDYPGMNVRLARLALRRGIPVHFVAPPQLWAYRAPGRPGADTPRLRRLRASLETHPGHGRAQASLQFLFPFEAGSYRPWTGRIYQGHFFSEPAFEPARGTRLLLCPGSRRGVLTRNLPLWLRAVRAFFGTLQGVDILVPEYLRDETLRLCEAESGGESKTEAAVILTDKREAFARAGASIAYPGTITLELFLARVPVRAWAVVDRLTLAVGRRVLRGPHLSLVNVLASREVVPEWVGTAMGFTRNPPPLPESITDWNPPDALNAVASVWAAMGSEHGVEEGVKACRALLPDKP